MKHVKDTHYTLDEWNAIVEEYTGMSTAELFEELCTLASKIQEIHAILEDRNLK